MRIKTKEIKTEDPENQIKKIEETKKQQDEKILKLEILIEEQKNTIKELIEKICY